MKYMLKMWGEEELDPRESAIGAFVHTGVYIIVSHVSRRGSCTSLVVFAARIYI